MRKSLLLSAFLLSALLFSGSAYASVTCQPIYGGGETCVSRGDIDIEKKVKHPDSPKGEAEKFVDNLSISESKYHAGDQVVFKLTVTNTGDATLSTVEVKDILPTYVTFVSGPGKFDANTKTLTYTLKDLKSKESRTETLVVKVVAESDLLIDNGSVCTVNKSFATSDSATTFTTKVSVLDSFATSDGMSDQDNALFCIEKKVLVTKGGLPVKPAVKAAQTPPTGPEMWALIGLIPAGLSGILLRRRSMKIRGGER